MQVRKKPLQHRYIYSCIYMRRWVLLARVWYLGVEHSWMLGWVATLILPLSILTLSLESFLSVLSYHACFETWKWAPAKKISSSSRKQHKYLHLIYLTPHDNHTHGTDASPSSAMQVTRGLARRHPSETSLSLAESCRKQQAREGGSVRF